MSVFSKIITEDFSTIAKYASSFNGSNSKSFKVLSKFSSLNPSDPNILNFTSVNKGLTQNYGTINNNNEKLYWNYDGIHDNMDRLLWSGEIKEDSNNYYLTNTVIEGKPIDGYMMVPAPYSRWTTGTSFSYQNPTSDCFKIKLKYNSLPANTFVPLFGYVVGRAESLSEVADNCYQANKTHLNPFLYKDRNTSTIDAGKMYVTNVGQPQVTLNYTVTDDVNTFLNQPTSFVHNSNNNYEISLHNTFSLRPSMKNTLIWFLYAHDGEGNGMIITTSSETNELDPALDEYRPWNSHYGMYNGYTQFRQPDFLTRWFTEGGTLSSLNEAYSLNGSASTNEMFKAFKTIHFYDAWNTTMADTNTNIDLFGMQDWFRKYSGDWSSSSGFNVYVSNADFAGSLSDATARFALGQLKWNYQGMGRISRANQGSTYSAFNWDFGGSENSHYTRGQFGLKVGYINPGAYNHLPMRIVSYGANTNADLSQLTEININAHKIGLSGYQNYFAGPYSTTTESGSTCASVYFDGVLGDLAFQDVVGHQFYDQEIIRYMYYRSQYNRGYGYATYPSLTSFTWNHNVGATAVVLRPGVIGDGEVHSITIGSLDNVFGIERYSTPTPEINSYTNIQNFYKSHRNLVRYKPKELKRYDGFAGVSQDASTIRDPQSNWSNKSLLLDGELGTKAQCTAPGYDNGILIPIDQASTNDDNIVEKINIGIRNIQLFSLKQYYIKVALLDSSQTIIAQNGGAASYNKFALDIVPTQIGVSFPSAEEFLSVIFYNEYNRPLLYRDIKNGFIKIWVEPVQ